MPALGTGSKGSPYHSVHFLKCQWGRLPTSQGAVLGLLLVSSPYYHALSNGRKQEIISFLILFVSLGLFRKVHFFSYVENLICCISEEHGRDQLKRGVTRSFGHSWGWGAGQRTLRGHERGREVPTHPDWGQAS